MSSLVAAGRVVARARRRLALLRAADLAATGALGGALAAVVVALALRIAGGAPLSAAWLAAPVAGAAAGAVVGLLRRPSSAGAALAVDRAAATHEAFLSALTALDAESSLRELSAGFALRGLGERSLRTLLPFGVPRLAAPALAAVALLGALTVIGRDSTAPAARPGPQSSVAVPGVGDAGGAAPGSGTTETVAVPAERGAAPDTVARPPEPPLPAMADAEVEGLARDLAERGVAGAAEALSALLGGDRATAEALLRQALSAGGGAPGGGPGAASAAGAGDAAARVAPGAWSAGAWPLRYDRAVRAWLRRQAATDGGGDARTEER